MKILIFNWRDLKHEWAGGSEVYITELAKIWVNKGHEVTLFCGQGIKNDLPSEETISGIRIIRKGGKYSVYIFAVWEYLTKLRHKYDVVIDVQNGMTFMSPLFSTKPKVSVVHHVHGKQFTKELPFPFSYIGYFIERVVFPNLYRNVKVVAVSETTKKALIENGVNERNIEIVYNAIDKTHPGGLTEKYKKPTILYLGRIKKYKRVDLLVNMMPQVLQKVPNAVLIIAGWGTEGAFVTELSMRRNLRKQVKILGKVSESEKRSLMSKSWVFVNPSMSEGWGISVIEANYHGTPAVAFDVPGLSESIQNDKTGYLSVTEKDFVDNIVKILTVKSDRKRLEKGGLEWSTKFSWDKSADKFMGIIKSEVNGIK